MPYAISAFVVRCIDSTIPLVSITEISSLYLASVAARAGLSLLWSQTLKTDFIVTRLNFDVAEGRYYNQNFDEKLEQLSLTPVIRDRFWNCRCQKKGCIKAVLKVCRVQSSY